MPTVIAAVAAVDREPGYRGVDACQRIVGFEEEVPLIRTRASLPSATST